MKSIPHIIHQIWSGIDGELPYFFKMLGNTWRYHHPNWEYRLWDNDKINKFIFDFYPEYSEKYNNFKYNIQRWDAIRYLILYKFGGLYVDFDYECIKPIDQLIKNIECCFSCEPEQHCIYFGKNTLFNNALIGCNPENDFIKKIISEVFNPVDPHKHQDRNMEVLVSTGPLMLTNLYEKYELKKRIYLIPAYYVSPFSKKESKHFLSGNQNYDLKERLRIAYAVHYFVGGWVK